MGDQHGHKAAASQPWASPQLFGVLLIGAVFFALFLFLCYYGWLHTPGKPWEMMQ